VVLAMVAGFAELHSVGEILDQLHLRFKELLHSRIHC
jgi:hypothetical protein